MSQRSRTTPGILGVPTGELESLESRLCFSGHHHYVYLSNGLVVQESGLPLPAPLAVSQLPTLPRVTVRLGTLSATTTVVPPKTTGTGTSTATKSPTAVGTLGATVGTAAFVIPTVPPTS